MSAPPSASPARPASPATPATLAAHERRLAWFEGAERAPDRDERRIDYFRGASRTRAAAYPRAAVPSGGALRRLSHASVGPGRDDETPADGVPGRYVPVGYARYTSPLVDPADYAYYRLGAWRVAIPHAVQACAVRGLLDTVWQRGPQGAGFVAIGDTLVPAILGPGDRFALAESAGW